MTNEQARALEKDIAVLKVKIEASVKPWYKKFETWLSIVALLISLTLGIINIKQAVSNAEATYKAAKRAEVYETVKSLITARGELEKAAISKNIQPFDAAYADPAIKNNFAILLAKFDKVNAELDNGYGLTAAEYRYISDCRVYGSRNFSQTFDDLKTALKVSKDPIDSELTYLQWIETHFSNPAFANPSNAAKLMNEATNLFNSHSDNEQLRFMSAEYYLTFAAYELNDDIRDTAAARKFVNSSLSTINYFHSKPGYYFQLKDFYNSFVPVVNNRVEHFHCDSIL